MDGNITRIAVNQLILGTPMDEDKFDLLAIEVLRDLDIALGYPTRYTGVLGWGHKTTTDPNSGWEVPTLTSMYESGAVFTKTQRLELSQNGDLINQAAKVTLGNLPDYNTKTSAYDYFMDKMSYHFNMDVEVIKQKLTEDEDEYDQNLSQDEKNLALKEKYIGPKTVAVASLTGTSSTVTDATITGVEIEPDYGISGMVGAIDTSQDTDNQPF